jgi:hypothetical protein
MRQEDHEFEASLGYTFFFFPFSSSLARRPSRHTPTPLSTP